MASHYWHLTTEQENVIQRIVKNRHITDFGAGDGTLAKHCLQLGAKKATAIEPKRMLFEASHPNLEWIHCFFAEVLEKNPKISFDVALLSWPWEGLQTKTLITLIKRAKTIVFLGCTTNSTSCGTPELWKFLASRKVKTAVPDPKNTLLVYKNLPRPDPKKILHTEQAGLDTKNIYPFINQP